MSKEILCDMSDFKKEYDAKSLKRTRKKKQVVNLKSEIWFDITR